jgi:hypothetical protein
MAKVIEFYVPTIFHDPLKGASHQQCEVCQFFCVNGPVLFLGMGARGKGQRPFPRPAM